jgi:Fur family zinc uptake transcriptional regulator
MKPESENTPDHPDHDHAACITDALADAERFCRQRGLRLTPTRRRVLEIVWRGHEPVKAYDILDALNRAGRRTAPPTVYRALDFLLEASLVHRIDSLNAFVGCPLASGEHTAQLLVCSRCETVTEVDDPAIRGILDRGAARHGFILEPQTVEVRGLCPRCRGLSA